MGKHSGVAGEPAAAGADGASPSPTAASPPPASRSTGAPPTSRTTAPPRTSTRHAASAEHGFEAMGKQSGGAGESAAMGAGDASPRPAAASPSRDRRSAASGSIGSAPASRATAPPQPSSRQHAASGAVISHAMEKPKANGDADESTATVADEAPPPSRGCVVGDSAASGALGATILRAPDPPRPREQHAARASSSSGAWATAEFDDVWSLVLAKFGRGRSRSNFNLAAAAACLNSSRDVGLDPVLPLPHPSGGIAANDDGGVGTYNSNSGSGQPTSSLLLALDREDGLEEGGTTADTGVNTAAEGPANTPTVATGEKGFDTAEQSEWETVLARWDTIKRQLHWSSQVESQAEETVWWSKKVASEKTLLEVEGKEEEFMVRLKNVEEEQKQKEANLQQREEELLLERLLLRERRAKMEEEEAALRARRTLVPRLPRWNSHDGISGRYARQTSFTFTNGHDVLNRPLLQSTQAPTSAPIAPEKPGTAAALASPTATSKTDEDETWNKRQIGYVFYLGLAVALLFLIRPLLPVGYDQWLLTGFAAVWGTGSIGLPAGIFGTTRLEKNCSRHIGRAISMCFALMVIYATYLLAVLPVDAGGATTSSPSPPPSTMDSTDSLTLWRIIFGAIALIVTLGHIGSWIMVVIRVVIETSSRRDTRRGCRLGVPGAAGAEKQSTEFEGAALY
ncbi:hypothetical protein ACP70R_019948 [Stipagrostis hirtigluma subsp. patula]